MLYKSYESESLPEYHKNLLIVKVDALAARRGLPIGMTPMWWRPTAGMVDPTPGVAALAYYERSGLIKRVTPLGPTPPAVSGKFAPPGVMSIFTRPFDDAVGAATDETSAAQFSRGVSVVELEEGANLEQLQLSIAADPFVSFASRVPVRYLMGARNTSSVGNLEPGQPAAVPNAAGGGATIAATPPPAGQMWNMRAIRWQQARDNGLNLADSVKVAVLDTGIDLDHPDLPGTEINYIHEYPESGASVSGRDIIGHGTHVAGTIRALVNSAGINGICECQLSAYKIFGDEPASEPINDGAPSYPYYVDPVLYWAALADCLDAGVQVVNLSIGGGGQPDPQEQQLFAALVNANVAVVAAMGNESSSVPSYPAAIPGVIAVAATTADDSQALFSNTGRHVALSAPGVGIWSTLPTYPGHTHYRAVRGPDGRWRRGQPALRETDYDAWDGTSMATPHVAAAAALAIAKYGPLTTAQLRLKLTAAVDKVAGMGDNDFSPRFGYGRLNLEKL